MFSCRQSLKSGLEELQCEAGSTMELRMEGIIWLGGGRWAQNGAAVGNGFAISKNPANAINTLAAKTSLGAANCPRLMQEPRPL